MKAPGKGPDQQKFSQVRNAKTLILVLLVVSSIGLSSYLVVTGGFNSDPLYVPLDRGLNILIITLVAVLLLKVPFRALEIKHAPKQGQRFLLADSAWRGAKRALGIGLILALFFAIPATQDLVTNALSPSDSRNLDAGESLPLSFTNQDTLGVIKSSALRVSVQSGTLRVRVSDGTRVINPGGTYLNAGDQGAIPLSTSSLITYTVNFENMANATTMFSYRVESGLPPAFSSLIFVLSAIVAGSNLVWLLSLKRLKERMPKPRPAARPVAPQTIVPRGTAAPTPRVPRTPATFRPWWQLQKTHGLARGARLRPTQRPSKANPPKGSSEEGRKLGMVREAPPPPSQIETYEVEIPPPPREGARRTEPRTQADDFALDISALLDKAEERVNSGEFQDALEDYDTVLMYDKRNLRALLNKAELLRRLRKPAEAIKHLDRALKLDHWQHKALLVKGELLEEEGRHDEALECYEDILRGGPEYVEAFLRKGDIMFQMKELELAMEAYQEALRMKPGDSEIEERIRALEEEGKDPLDRAIREAATGNYKAAEELFLRSLEGEQPSEARRGLIDLYMQTDREEEALNLLDEAIDEEPGDLDLILRRVKSLSRRGRLADALAACESACEVAPEEASIWAIRGALEADLGLGTRAVESLEKALQLDPDDTESAERLSEIHQRGEEGVELEAVVQEIAGVPKKAVKAILKAYTSLKELKSAQVKALASLDGVSETAAKKVLRAVRKGG